MPMTKLLTLALILAGIPHQQGWASQYSANMMKPTIVARIDMGHITHKQVKMADVYVAVVDCNRLGEMGFISINGASPEVYLVADCARRDDGDGAKSWMEKNNIIVELNHAAAVRHGVEGEGGVRALMWSNPSPPSSSR